MCIAIVCFPGSDFINFEPNLIFLIDPFFLMTKSQDKNLNILRGKRAFKVKEKVFFVIFKELSVSKSCLKLESGQKQEAKSDFYLSCE